MVTDIIIIDAINLLNVSCKYEPKLQRSSQPPRGKRWQGRWTSQDRGRGSPITIRIINMKLPKSGMATALEEKGLESLDARASHAGPLNPERADCELTVSSPDSILTAIIHTGMKIKILLLWAVCVVPLLGQFRYF